MENNTIGILIFASHPIQYYVPLYKELNNHFNIKVIYFSDTGLKDRYVEGIGKLPKWDIPLLDGYNYQFLKNIGKNNKGFFSRINFGIYKAIKDWKGEYILISGWNNFSCLMAMVIGKFLNKKILIRSDSNVKNINSSFFNTLIKKIIFLFVDKILYVGYNNKEYFKYYNQPENKFIFTPFSVDNNRFQIAYKNEAKKTTETKKSLGVHPNDFVFIFVGKLIKIKGVLELIKAFDSANLKDSHLLIVGTGNMEDELKEYVSSNNLTKNIHFIGYKNQLELPMYYAISDVFILPSLFEPWGLVVNEAMNFSLPLILSDKAGCVEDLLKEGVNGFTFNGDIKDNLKETLIKVRKIENFKANYGKHSLEIINKYSNIEIVNQLKKHLI